MQYFFAVLRNLRAGARLSVFRRIGLDAFSVTPAQVLTLLAVIFAIGSLYDLVDLWPIGGLSQWGMATTLAGDAVITLALLAGLILIWRGAEFAPVLAVTLSSLPLPLLVSTGVMLWLPWDILNPWLSYGVYWGMFLWPIIVVWRSVMIAASAGLLRSAVPVGMYVAALFGTASGLGQYPVFEPRVEPGEAAAWTPPLDVEALYYAQPELVSARLDSIPEGIPGTPELFGLVAGYYPHERVFLREVDAIPGILAERFDADGRIIQLANSEAEPLRHPMANERNITAALEVLAERMNPEDVALIYITSHGLDELISAGYWSVGTPSLTGSNLALMLDQSGLRNVVVVISACKSGSFVPLLQAPDRVVMTAAAAARNSFGCSDASEWTWFGRAMFEGGLAETDDFLEAFEIAAAKVADWEKESGYEPSEPQIAIGADIAKSLGLLAARNAD